MLMNFAGHRRRRQHYPIELQLILADHLQEPVIRPNGVSMHQWFYCTKGAGVLDVGQEHYIVREGQAFFVAANDPHSYSGTTEDFTLDNIAFAGKCAMPVLRDLHMGISGVYQISSKDLFPHYLGQILEIHNSGRKNPYFDYSRLCYSFLIELSSLIHPVPPDHKAEGSSISRDITAYLEEHIGDPITLDDLADYMHLTKEYCCTVFKRTTGQTIVQVFTGMRIARARLLLVQHPEKPVKEIGQACGYDSPSYFGKVFRKVCGVSPEEYRTRMFQ